MKSEVMGAMAEAHQDHPHLSCCVMPNHWHMVLWPRHDGNLTEFVGWMTHTHTMRRHAQHHTSGTAHLDQARFKSLPIESEAHLDTVAPDVERNALRAELVKRAEEWQCRSVGAPPW